MTSPPPLASSSDTSNAGNPPYWQTATLPTFCSKKTDPKVISAIKNLGSQEGFPNIGDFLFYCTSPDHQGEESLNISLANGDEDAQILLIAYKTTEPLEKQCCLMKLGFEVAIGKFWSNVKDEDKVYLLGHLRSGMDATFTKYLFATPHEQVTEEGETLLHLLVARKEIGYIHLLPNIPEGVSIKNKDGETPLHLAVQQDNPIEVINALLKKGLNINVQNNLGETPLHYARKASDQKLMGLLETRGASRWIFSQQEKFKYGAISMTTIVVLTAIGVYVYYKKDEEGSFANRCIKRVIPDKAAERIIDKTAERVIDKAAERVIDKAAERVIDKTVEVVDKGVKTFTKASSAPFEPPTQNAFLRALYTAYNLFNY